METRLKGLDNIKWIQE